MNWQLWLGSFTLATGVVISASGLAQAQYAVEVISYAQGSTPATNFTDQTAPLGEPERFTGGNAFPGVVSPFSSPFLATELISIGEGGSLTLRLSNFALPQAGGPEIGIFTNASLIDTSFPNGQAGSPPGTFGVDSALVEVSENGVDWESLGETTFDLPSNGYTDLMDPFSDTPGNNPSDFQQPFTGSLSSFDGLSYFDASNPDILDLLAGSGGGTWLDISGTSFSQVGYVRFSVADDGNAGTGLNFELDAVSIAASAVGAATVPEPHSLALLGLAGVLLSVSYRPRRKSAM